MSDEGDAQRQPGAAQSPLPALGRPKNDAPHTDASSDGSSRKIDEDPNRFDRDLVRWTRAVAVLTGLLFVGALLQFGAAMLQWSSMRGQLREARSGGIDTQNLARAAKDQATATGNLVKSSAAQAVSMSSLAISTAGELDALKNAAAIAKGEADSMRVSANAALKAADTSTGQLAVLNRQMELSQTAFSLDHRPRLKFEINESTGPLEVTNQGIVFGLSAKFTNVGNLEAEEVSYGYSFSIADTEEQMRGAQGTACSQAEAETAKASVKIGEELGWNTTIATNRGDFTRFMQLPDKVAIVDLNPRRYAFAGCVVYKSPVDKIARHTRFLYYIGERMNGKIVPGIMQIPHKVAPGDILVSKDAFAGNNDD